MSSSKKTSGVQTLTRLILSAAMSLSLPISVASAESIFVKAPSDLSDLRAITLELGGMHCAGCSLRIRKALQSIKGVAKLEEGATRKSPTSAGEGSVEYSTTYESLSTCPAR